MPGSVRCGFLTARQSPCGCHTRSAPFEMTGEKFAAPEQKFNIHFKVPFRGFRAGRA